jgi:hydroxyacylglutathione hydrolase
MEIRNVVVGYLQTNCYILSNNSGEAIIIDPGGEAGKIEKHLKGLHPKYIVLTHGHSDHFGAVDALKNKYNPITAIHSSDVDILNALTDIKIDLLLEEGSIISIDGISLKVLHTPGHSKGCICLYDGNKKLFTGDTLFADTCGRTDLMTGSDKDMNGSLKKLFSMDRDIRIYPGHGPTALLKETIEKFN